MRTDTEIKHRAEETDNFGVRRPEVLRFETDEVTWQRAVNRLPYAWSVVANHLYFACARESVRYDAWLWRLFGDPDYHQWLTLPYRPFGAPRLLGATLLLGGEQPADDRLIRMAHGEACADDCTRGCLS